MSTKSVSCPIFNVFCYDQSLRDKSRKVSVVFVSKALPIDTAPLSPMLLPVNLIRTKCMFFEIQPMNVSSFVETDCPNKDQ